MGVEWSTADQSTPGWMDVAGMIGIAAANPLDTPYEPKEWNRKGDYVPGAPGTPTQAAAYGKGAEAFRKGRFKDAVTAFDEAAADGSSPYAAAASYSAARAVMDEGEFEDGTRRIGKILADPRLREMHHAAQDLIGTLANETGASPLVAMRLEQIKHLLMAPQQLRCVDDELKELMDEASGDLEAIVRETFNGDRYLEPWGAHTRGIMERLGRKDQFIDLIRVMAAPTPFNRNGPWMEPFMPGELKHPGFPSSEQEYLDAVEGDGKALTDHASERAGATRNPLWAYALSIRSTDTKDIAVLEAATKALEAARIDDADRDVLIGALIAGKARILLMSGQRNEAVAAMDAIPDRHDRSWLSARIMASQDGTRFLLAKRDIEGARDWSTRTTTAGTTNGSARFDAALATSWPELVTKYEPDLNSEAIKAGLDLLTADRMVELSRIPEIDPDLRRTMLSSAWMRYHAMGRDEPFKALFTEIRAAFPEVGADIDAVNNAWTDSQRHHLTTRMLLKLPGMTIRPSWSAPTRARSWMGYYGDKKDVTRVDTVDPSDGNWWCPADPGGYAIDYFTEAFESTISSMTYDRWEEERVARYDGANEGTMTELKAMAMRRTMMESLASDWIRWQPLFHGEDMSETDKLSKVESGPVMLGREALAWAHESNALTRAAGLDDTLAETLALAVRATRWGCRRTGRIDQVSKDAWSQLHALYPKSPEAIATKYWFDMRSSHEAEVKAELARKNAYPPPPASPEGTPDNERGRP